MSVVQRTVEKSHSKRLGVKIFVDKLPSLETFIVRQRGTQHNAGENVYIGKDHTLHAKIDGIVKFEKKKNDKSYVSVIPLEA